MKTYTLSFLKYTIRVTPEIPSAVAFSGDIEIALTPQEMQPTHESYQSRLFDLLVTLWEKLLPYTDRATELMPMCNISNYTIEENVPPFENLGAKDQFNRDQWYLESLEKLDACIGVIYEEEKELVQGELF